MSLALYKPFGIAGLVIGTAVASLGMTLEPGLVPAPGAGRAAWRAGARVIAVAQMCVAAAALGGAAYLTWWGIDDAAGRSVPAQIVSVGLAIVAGSLIYAGAVLLMRIREAEQILALVRARLHRARPA